MHCSGIECGDDTHTHATDARACACAHTTPPAHSCTAATAPAAVVTSGAHRRTAQFRTVSAVFSASALQRWVCCSAVAAVSLWCCCCCTCVSRARTSRGWCPPHKHRAVLLLVVPAVAWVTCGESTKNQGRGKKRLVNTKNEPQNKFIL